MKSPGVNIIKDIVLKPPQVQVKHENSPRQISDIYQLIFTVRD